MTYLQIFVNLIIKSENKNKSTSRQNSNKMIFTLPKSKSYMNPTNNHKKNKNQLYQKQFPKQLQLHGKIQESPHDRCDSFTSFNSQSLICRQTKFIQSPKKRLIYTHKRSHSVDKYLMQNKKQVYKQIIIKNLNNQQRKIYKDTFQNKSIYYGKKLVDPIHKKYKYCIQNKIHDKTPFLVNDFLLEPCKIQSKKLQLRPYSSYNIPYSSNSKDLNDSKSQTNNQKRKNGLSRTYTNGWKTNRNSQKTVKISKQIFEFSNQMLNLNSRHKFQRVDPWQQDNLIQNFQSIKIV